MSEGHHRWSVPGRLIAALAVVSAGAFAVALRAAPPERLLFTVLATSTAAEALRSWLLRPTLEATAYGIVFVSGLRRERHPWAAVVNVAPLAPPGGGGRLRRNANALEIDLGDRLVVLPGYRLGAPVSQVAAELNSSRGSDGGS